MPDDVISVHNTPLPDQAWSGLRSVIIALTAFAAGRGWIGHDTVTLLLAVAGVLGPVAVSQLKARRRALQLATITAHVSGTVAKLKSKKGT